MRMANRARNFVQSALLVSFAGLGCNAILGIDDPRTEVPADVSAPEEAGGPSAEADASRAADARSDARRDAARLGPCYIEEEALAITGIAPSARPGKCTPSQIAELKTKCLPAGATGCDAFLEANKDCARCILGARQGDEPSTTPMPALVPVSPNAVEPNIVACAALVSGRPDCAVKATQQFVCTKSACTICPADEDSCTAFALIGICKTTVDAACDSAIKASTAQWQPICLGTLFDDPYLKVAAYLCGSE